MHLSHIFCLYWLCNRWLLDWPANPYCSDELDACYPDEEDLSTSHLYIHEALRVPGVDQPLLFIAGATPLEQAAAHGHGAIITLLLRGGVACSKSTYVCGPLSAAPRTMPAAAAAVQAVLDLHTIWTAPRLLMPWILRLADLLAAPKSRQCSPVTLLWAVV
jgi:hypothetical protein